MFGLFSLLYGSYNTYLTTKYLATQNDVKLELAKEKSKSRIDFKVIFFLDFIQDPENCSFLQNIKNINFFRKFRIIAAI